MSGSVRAEDRQGRPYDFTVNAGFSSFTGIIGFENRFEHWALDIGAPWSGGVRYYFQPHRHSWFAGLYGQGFGYDHDETKDDVPYTHYSTISGGAGAGYRWFWRERWSLQLGLTVGYAKEEWTSDAAWRKETGIRIAPIAVCGATFW